MDRTRAYEYVHYFKMADRRGLTFLTMFSTAKCKVTAGNNTLPVSKDGFTYCTPNFRGWIRAVQKLSDLIESNSCQCNAKQGLFLREKW